MLSLKGKPGQLIIWYALIFSIAFAAYLSIYEPQLSPWLKGFLFASFSLIYFWLAFLVEIRKNNVIYKSYVFKHSKLLNLSLVILGIVFGTIAAVLTFKNDYFLSMRYFLWGDITWMLFFIFNELYHPLGANTAILVPLQAKIIQLNNLEIIVNLISHIPNKSIKLKLAVLKPKTYLQDECLEKITLPYNNIILKDVFNRNFYQGYVIEVVQLAEQAVMFKLVKN